MYDFKALALSGCCAAALAGCGGALQEARQMTPAGSDFAKALHHGYITLAQAELDETDLEDAKVFSLRARSAAMGNPEPPETVKDREIPGDYVDDVIDARARLMAVFGRGATTKEAGKAAEAQVMYECWTQELEENFQPADIVKCKQGFEVAMAYLQTRVTPKKAAITPPKMPVSAKAPPKKAASLVIKVAATPSAKAAPKTKFTVWFDFDGAGIKKSTRSVIDQAIASARILGATVIKVTGHADRSGTDDYNRALSARRAEAVAATLTQLDGSRHKVSTEAAGETKPAVETPDGVKDPRNRRVEIELIN